MENMSATPTLNSRLQPQAEAHIGSPSPAACDRPVPALDATVDLIARVQTGDQSAWDTLINRYLQPLKQLGHNRLRGHARSMADTDDVVQDALIKTIRRLGQVDCRNRGALSAYLRRAVINRIVDAARRSARLGGDGSEAEACVDQSPSPLDHLLGKEETRRYRAALKLLAPRDRRLIALRLQQRMPYRELAEHLGLSSPDAARMASMRALLRFAEALKGL